jgi:hypothetical protein
MMPTKDTAFDSEYTALMQELGEQGGHAMPGGIPQVPKNEIPPWRMPENWQNQPFLQGQLFQAHFSGDNKADILGGFRGPPGGGGGYQGGGGGGYGQQQQHQNPGYGYGQGGGPPQGYGGGGGGGYGGPPGQVPGGAPDAYQK